MGEREREKWERVIQSERLETQQTDRERERDSRRTEREGERVAGT